MKNLTLKIALRSTALLLLVNALTSCMTETLTVHTDYINHDHLASSYIGTPDPLREVALVGQRLIVSWWLPPRYKTHKQTEIQIKLRYGNREEREMIIPIKKRLGWYVYTLPNQEYFDKKGIKTYYVQLWSDGELVDEWKHQLWVNLIEFTDEAKDTNDNEEACD